MALPDGLQFLKFGWWVVHAIAFLLVYQFGFVRGRGAMRREQREREIAQAGRERTQRVG